MHAEHEKEAGGGKRKEMTWVKLKIFYALIFFQTAFCGCKQENRHLNFEWKAQHYKAKLAFRLPKEVDESSGAIGWTDSTFLTHNDDGAAELFEVGYDGKLKGRIPIPMASNKDWEALTTDGKGTIYIGDVGNNWNRRKDLRIYPYKPGSATVDTMSIVYDDQKEWPPTKAGLNFDCEAMFWRRDSIFLVSKNRGRRTVKLYGVPAKAGCWVAKVLDSVRLEHMVTDAAYDAQKGQLVLAAYGMVYLFGMEANAGRTSFGRPLKCLRFARSGQAESAWFGKEAADSNGFYVGNEAGKVFRFEQR